MNATHITVFNVYNRRMRWTLAPVLQISDLWPREVALLAHWVCAILSSSFGHVADEKHKPGEDKERWGFKEKRVVFP